LIDYQAFIPINPRNVISFQLVNDIPVST